MGDAGSYIFQGLSSMGNAMAARQDRQRAQQEQEEKEIKEANKRRKLFVSMGEQMGMNKDLLEMADAEEAEGAVKGYMADLTNKDRAETAARDKQKFEMAVAQQQAQMQADAAFAAALNPPGRLDPNSIRPQSIPPKPPTVADALQAALQNPNARAAAPFLQQAAQGAEPMRQFQNETERMRAEAYRRQVESMLLNKSLANWPGAAAAAPTPKMRYQHKDENGDTVTMTLTPQELEAYKAANPGKKTMMRQGQITALREELKQHDAKILTGDERYGLANHASRLNRVKAIKKQLAELGADEQEAIPQDWIEYLKQHPASATSFDAKFGTGAAARYLQ